ncbi:extracellular solute-binding protein [Thermasporomyces composti]|jgi:putative aldouronate transport system substrate-binding protein|uniref:Carbohydrate ABC transporter substrate-binding protein (CUT1 family) n=1 Tax=Thermasporomyces composti TaxID=696763 RepID=A0A3D9V6Q9_THECX|nr:extracellular solute-binding protein [Thermasporomyces composti]REF37197.1 carbohydrate ABC transporter substrate-binding protein (CUT1 family) [Thermasporomyces composti]
MAEEHHGTSKDPAVSGMSRRQFVTHALGIGLSAASTAAFLASCSGGGNPQGGSVPEDPLAQKGGPKSSPNNDPIYPEGYVGPVASHKQPLVKERVTLRIVVPQNTAVGDWKENLFTKWYEEITGVHIEWHVVAGEAGSSDAMTKVNAMIASGDLPDAFMNIDFSPAQQMLYGSQGLFVPLNDLIDEYCVEIKRIFEAYPDVKELVTANDGNIYTMPYVNDCFHCNCGIQRMWIYKPWLDELGLSMPTTLDEFEDVLTAFVNEDPNRNGKKDELPLMGHAHPGWPAPLSNFFMGSFMYNPGGPASNRPYPWLYLNDGKVDIVVNKPEWREGWRYQNRLYRKGLIAKESFTQDLEALQRIGNREGDNILGVVRAWDWGSFMTVDASDPDARWHGYVCVPTLKGPDGTAISSWNYYGKAGNNAGFVVTSACKYPGLAVQWADGLYELEAQLRLYYGDINEGWRWAKEGEKGINGKQALYKALITWPPEDGIWWGQLGLSFRSNEFRLSEAVDPKAPTFEQPLYEESKKYYEARQDQRLQLPLVYLTEEQASITSEIELAIENHVLQHEAKFTMGELDINDNAAWETYVDTLNRIGLENYLRAYQEAYDAKYS